jgi:hypothetical protein
MASGPTAPWRKSSLMSGKRLEPQLAGPAACSAALLIRPGEHDDFIQGDRALQGHVDVERLAEVGHEQLDHGKREP